MDLISRRDAIDAVGSMLRRKFGIGGDLAEITLAGLPSAQPETDGFCTDCKEYDQERHFCPRFDRVIKTTIDEMKAEQRWIPCSERLPEDGVYLIYAPNYKGGSSSAKEWHHGIMFSKFKNGKWSIEHGYYERPNCVLAWMPLPEPYREDGEADD